MILPLDKTNILSQSLIVESLCAITIEVLPSLQREAKEQRVPIIVVFEGFGASGKGYLINKLIHPMDPRGFSVYTTERETEEERLHPFLWRFWTKTPAKGRIAVFDTSWYRKVLVERGEKKISDEQAELAFEEIKNFERQLVDDGTVIIKIFLHISKKEQRKRFDSLLASEDTAWKVTKEDQYCHKHFNRYLSLADEMLERTNSATAPWTIVEAKQKEFAVIKVLSTVVGVLSTVCNERRQENRQKESKVVFQTPYEETIKTSVLNQVDLSLKLSGEEYKERLKKVQKRLQELQNKIYEKRIPVVIAFEGWDAAGKGGAIKRLTEPLDPRGYQVNPTSAPNDVEKEHHYLWRFWNTIPKGGHIAIYDRTWYGRVMVERIEGFCTVEEWSRAYAEINEMEEHLYDEGTIVLKFWLHIDKEEQEKRFKERMNNPEKQWKITDEDWRNREKWEQYEEAVNEMIVRTSTTYAPLFFVVAND
ncbi:MAG: polyphosphate:AMP phosphotransferase [Clostridiales bacterium]|nr:polyphosphate:AMP phosphotransferase [Clostridiales bacterium]